MVRKRCLDAVADVSLLVCCMGFSDVDHAGQLLHPIEKDVSLFDALLVLSILTVRSVGYHDTTNLINLCMKPPTGNEPAQLLVHVSLSHTKGICHVGKSEGPVRLKQLSISFHLDLPDIVGIMGRQVPISFHNLLQLSKCCEEVTVLAIVQREQVVSDLRRLVENLQNLTAFYHILVQVRPVQSKDRDPHSILNKLDVVHQLIAGESRDCIKEELCAELEVPHRHCIQALIHLEPVPSIPVPSLLQHLLCLANVGRGDGVVVVEKPDADVQEHQVHTVAQTHCFLSSLPYSFNSSIFVANLREELCLLEQRLPSLTLPKILCGIRNGSLQS